MKWPPILYQRAGRLFLMCVCKNGYNQTGCRQNNHKDLVISHKHPPPVKLRPENHSRSTGCPDKYIILSKVPACPKRTRFFLIPFRIIVHNVEVMLNVFRRGFDIGSGMGCEQFIIGCMFGKYFIFLKSFFIGKKSVLSFN